MTDVPAMKAQLVKLQSARASGILEIQFADRRTRYRADNELKAAIDDLERRIAEAERGPTRVIYISDQKGL